MPEEKIAMDNDPLISADDARTLAGALFLDCGFDLFDTAAGERTYTERHLPGAHYLHVDRDLSGPKKDAQGRFRGRHPLPDRTTFAARVGALGIAPGVPVVAYDAQGGPYAARAWWLLRWLGHDAVQVLDGGLQAWAAAGGALVGGSTPAPGGAPYPAAAAPGMPVIEADALLAQLGRVNLIDARAPERFRGEVEPLDAAAGHIPGAHNRFFKDNLAPDGRFKPHDELRAAFAPLLGGAGAPGVQLCGSGVTACHNLLAAAQAGFGITVLYPGSWSEWSADASRPRARE
jgi:thiosulfate/3-mercaptopyruvate sulfurtransferase